MPTTVTSPFELIYDAVKDAINAEFTDMSIDILPDELHEALGERRIAVGIAPIRETPRANGMQVQDTVFHIQWFGLWDKKVDPGQLVDPRPITNVAERLRIALRPQSTGLGDKVWFFNIEDVTYPRDPTGNKTRFVMTLRALGRNAGLVETTD